VEEDTTMDTPTAPPDKMDRAFAERIGTEFAAMIKPWAEARGLTAILGNGTFDPAEGWSRHQLRFQLKTVGGKSAEQVAWERDCWRVNLKPTDYGRLFEHAGLCYRMVGVRPRGGRTPLVAQRQDNLKRYKFIVMPEWKWVEVS
jgi:hypothetical protein